MKSSRLFLISGSIFLFLILSVIMFESIPFATDADNNCWYCGQPLGTGNHWALKYVSMDCGDGNTCANSGWEPLYSTYGSCYGTNEIEYVTCGDNCAGGDCGEGDCN